MHDPHTHARDRGCTYPGCDRPGYARSFISTGLGRPARLGQFTEFSPLFVGGRGVGEGNRSPIARTHSPGHPKTAFYLRI